MVLYRDDIKVFPGFNANHPKAAMVLVIVLDLGIFSAGATLPSKISPSKTITSLILHNDLIKKKRMVHRLPNFKTTCIADTRSGGGVLTIMLRHTDRCPENGLCFFFFFYRSP